MTTNGPTSTDEAYMNRAARLALRGHGGAEPNPMVGCLIVAGEGEIVGWGLHRRFGEAHAEIEALERAGERARGATAYLTLEPCNHEGKTGPCSEALVRAGVGRVVIARRDPNPPAAGGAERLAEAGITVDHVPHPAAVAASEPFAHRVRTGLPWVVAKWAQTLDGRIATRTGASRWISSEASRRLVHRERGRVDAILTAIGTVLADDPVLTARGVRVRRTARRVVIDPDLRIPLDAKLVRTARDVPTTVACDEESRSAAERRSALEAAGVEVIALRAEDGDTPLRPVLRALVERHDAMNVLVEAGAGLTGRLLREGLVNEAWIFVAPMILGDEEAFPCVRGTTAPSLNDGIQLDLQSHHLRGGDVVLRYRTGQTGPGQTGPLLLCDFDDSRTTSFVSPRS